MCILLLLLRNGSNLTQSIQHKATCPTPYYHLHTEYSCSILIKIRFLHLLIRPIIYVKDKKPLYMKYKPLKIMDMDFSHPFFLEIKSYSVSGFFFYKIKAARSVERLKARLKARSLLSLMV